MSDFTEQEVLPESPPVSPAKTSTEVDNHRDTEETLVPYTEDTIFVQEKDEETA